MNLKYLNNEKMNNIDFSVPVIDHQWFSHYISKLDHPKEYFPY